MDWVKTKEKEPEEGQEILITNHCFNDPRNERYYVVAKFTQGVYIEPETDEVLYAPDFWCEIVGPNK